MSDDGKLKQSVLDELSAFNLTRSDEGYRTSGHQPAVSGWVSARGRNQRKPGQGLKTPIGQVVSH